MVLDISFLPMMLGTSEHKAVYAQLEKTFCVLCRVGYMTHQVYTHYKIRSSTGIKKIIADIDPGSTFEQCCGFKY